MQIFNASLLNEKLENKRKYIDRITVILFLIIIPLFSCFMTTLGEINGGNRAVFNSISSLAYVDGQLAWVIVWGLLNVGGFVYLFVLNTIDGGINKYFKLFFIISACIGFVLLTIASLIPCTYGSTEREIYLRKWHNVFSHWGFGFVVVNTILYALILFFRDKKQFQLTFSAFIFVMIIILYAVFEANEKEYSDANISSIAQVFVFIFLNLYLVFCYFTNRFFKAKEIDKEKTKKV